MNNQEKIKGWKRIWNNSIFQVFFWICIFILWSRIILGKDVLIEKYVFWAIPLFILIFIAGWAEGQKEERGKTRKWLELNGIDINKEKR